MNRQMSNSILVEYMILVEKLLKGEKEPKQYIEDTPISRSEIHMMAIIASSNNIHISELARKFNVTKGAVSKTVGNLKKKGLIEKKTDPENHSRILISLTDKGLEANRVHERIHCEINKEFMEYYNSLSKEDIGKIIAFLHKVQDMSERHL